MHRIYLAGRFEDRDEIHAYADALIDAGCKVTSSWLYNGHTPVSAEDLSREELRAFAMQDMRDIAKASTFVLFTHNPYASATNGRLVELGVALAGRMEIVIIGPEENIFTRLADVRYDTFEDFLREEVGRK